MIVLERDDVRVRSVIPGRQRWDVPVIRGSREVAELLVVGLQDFEGILEVQANMVTGRLLVLHDLTLTSEVVADLVRRAAALVVPDHSSHEEDSSAEAAPPADDSQLSVRHSDGVALVGGLVVVGAGALFGSPILALAGVLGSTALIVRNAWRRSSARQELTGRPKVRRPLRRIIGRRRGQLYRASLLSVLAQLLFLAPSVVIVTSFSVLIYGPKPWLVGLGFTTAVSQHLVLASAVAVLLLGFAAVSHRAGVAWRRLSEDVQHDWRTQVYAHLQRGEQRFLDGERATQLADAVKSDVERLGGFLSGPASDVLQVITSVAALVPIFLIAAPHLTWMVFLPIPFIAWLSFSYEQRSASDVADSAEKNARLNSQLVNNMEASATIKSLGAEDYEIERIRGLSEAVQFGNQVDQRHASAHLQTVQLLATGAFFGVLVAGGLDVLAGVLSFGVYNALSGLPHLMHGKLPGLGGAIERYQKTIVSLHRVQELLEIPVESADVGRELDAARVTGELVLDHVWFAYPDRAPVLNDLSMTVTASGITGIAGVTGAGKTTIAKLLLRLQDATAGRVLLDGTDVREFRLRDLRAAIGFVGQDAFLFDGSIADNIRYGSFDATDERVVAAARMAAAASFIEELPDQYDTLIGEKGITLSGGQRQRISLARVIAKAAPILILDEATSAVDNETEASIQDALREFARDRTVIIIAHRLSTIRQADWIYVMGQGGTVAEQGTHDALVAQDGLYASLWRRQIGGASE